MCRSILSLNKIAHQMWCGGHTQEWGVGVKSNWEVWVGEGGWMKFEKKGRQYWVFIKSGC